MSQVYPIDIRHSLLTDCGQRPSLEALPSIGPLDLHYSPHLASLLSLCQGTSTFYVYHGEPVLDGGVTFAKSVFFRVEIAARIQGHTIPSHRRGGSIWDSRAEVKKAVNFSVW